MRSATETVTWTVQDGRPAFVDIVAKDWGLEITAKVGDVVVGTGRPVGLDRTVGGIKVVASIGKLALRQSQYDEILAAIARAEQDPRIVLRNGIETRERLAREITYALDAEADLIERRYACGELGRMPTDDQMAAAKAAIETAQRALREYDVAHPEIATAQDRDRAESVKRFLAAD